MDIKSKAKDNCFVIIITILMISFTFNIYQGVVNIKYGDELRKLNYSKVEEIRYRNESNLAILDGCITADSINNEELLTLYKNYSKIAEAEVQLWNAYLGENNKIFIKNKIATNKSIITTKNELYWQIEELIYTYIQSDMKEKVEVMELKGKILDNFITLRNMANDLNDYFINFYEDKCNINNEEKKIKKIINENYWIDILEGIQGINNKYINYSFIEN